MPRYNTHHGSGHIYNLATSVTNILNATVFLAITMVPSPCTSRQFTADFYSQHNGSAPVTVDVHGVWVHTMHTQLGCHGEQDDVDNNSCMVLSIMSAAAAVVALAAVVAPPAAADAAAAASVQMNHTSTQPVAGRVLKQQ